MLLLSAILTLGAAAAPADDARLRASPAAQHAHPSRSHAAMLDGVVTNGTTLLAGQAFYRHFCAHWYDKPLNEMFAIAVRERASARRGMLTITTTDKTTGDSTSFQIGGQG